MQVNRTQTYHYHRNKDIHYVNIATSKPAILDHIQPSTARTLQTHARPQNRDIPYLLQHDIAEANRNITHRIVDIFDSKQTQLDAIGDYARYNQFERQFRRRNPCRDNKQREIQLENAKIYKTISKMKPRIGSLSEWEEHHKKTSSYSKIKSRYQRSSSKDSDQLSLFQSTLPQELLQLQQNLRKQRNEGKGRGGLGINQQGKRVELPYINRSRHI